MQVFEGTIIPDSMTTLGQRWQTVVPLADGWRWVRRSQSWLNNISGQRWTLVVLTPRFANKKRCTRISLVEQHRASVGPTSRFAIIKRILIGRFINIGPTIFTCTCLHIYFFKCNKRNDKQKYSKLYLR